MLYLVSRLYGSMFSCGVSTCKVRFRSSFSHSDLKRKKINFQTLMSVRVGTWSCGYVWQLMYFRNTVKKKEILMKLLVYCYKKTTELYIKERPIWWRLELVVTLVLKNWVSASEHVQYSLRLDYKYGAVSGLAGDVCWWERESC